MRKLCLIGMALFLYTASTWAQGYKVGDEAMDFNFKNVNEEMISMASYPDAKGFILVFTCNSCPFSVMYEDRINALNEKYEEKGFPVIAINPNDPIRSGRDSYSKMITRAEEKNFSFPYLASDNIVELQKIARTYGATNTPHTYVLHKKENAFIVEYIGAIDDNPQNADGAEYKYVEAAVDALLKGQSVKKTETRAIGCTIKWASK